MKLSKDGKFLLHDKANNADKTCWDKVRGYCKIELSKIVGIIYGGSTSTFEKIRKKVVRIHALDRESRVKILDHYDSRRSIKLFQENGKEHKLL